MAAVPSYAIPAPERQPDAVTREVITGKLLATVDEMAIVLARASMSPVIYEVLDFACGICDPQGDLVAQTNGITSKTNRTKPGASSGPFTTADHSLAYSEERKSLPRTECRPVKIGSDSESHCRQVGCDQDQVALVGREPLALLEQAVEARETGELHLPGRVAVCRVVVDDGVHLRGRAGHEDVDVLPVQPGGQVVLDDAVLQEGDPPPAARPASGSPGPYDDLVDVRGDELDGVQHQQLPAQRPVGDHPAAEPVRRSRLQSGVPRSMTNHALTSGRFASR